MILPLRRWESKSFPNIFVLIIYIKLSGKPNFGENPHIFCFTYPHTRINCNRFSVEHLRRCSYKHKLDYKCYVSCSTCSQLSGACRHLFRDPPSYLTNVLERYQMDARLHECTACRYLKAIRSCIERQVLRCDAVVFCLLFNSIVANDCAIRFLYDRIKFSCVVLMFHAFNVFVEYDNVVKI